MKESPYKIIITADNGVTTGVFQISEPGKPISNINFDPTTILCDLFDTVNYEKEYDYESENYYLNNQYFKHPFFKIDLPEDIIQSRFHSHVHYYYFFDFIVTLKELCDQKTNISLNQFEVYKQYFNSDFTYKIEFEDLNPCWGLTDITEDGTIIEDDRMYTFQSVSEIRDFTIRELFNFHTGQPFRHSYNCHSLADIICSVWHYLILHDYKFARCNHCGRYFATQTLKKQYCDRNSTYKNFEHLNCEQAVRNIKQKLARRKNSAYTYLSNYYEGGVDLFLEEHFKLKKMVDNNPCVDNLKALEEFLSKENVSKKWYKVEYR